MVDKLFTFFGHPNIKRVLALLLFVGGVILLRHLAALYVFYLILSRGFGFLATKLSGWTRVGEKVWVVALVVLLLGAIGGGVYAGVHRSLPTVIRLSHSAPERVQAFKDTDLYKMVEEHVDLDKYEEQIQHFTQSLLKALRSTGRVLLHLVIALILAVLYLFERREVDALYAGVPARSVLGNVVAFFTFAADAILLTV